MIGTWLNVLGIVAGGMIGLTFGRYLSSEAQLRIKVFLAALVVYSGLKMTWDAVSGTPLQVLKQLAIALLALSLGNFTGALLRLQKGMNAVGRLATQRFRRATGKTEGSKNPGDGFVTATLIY